MISESSLTLRIQQRNWNIPRPRNVVRTSLKQSMWHQGFNYNFAKLREYFLCTKKTKITIYSTIHFPELPSSAILESTPEHNQLCLCLWGKACICVVILSKMAEEGNSGEKNCWRKLLFLFSLHTQKCIFVASQKWSWATDVTLTVLPMSLLCFWTWEHFCIAVYGRVKAYRFHQKYLNLCSEDERRSYGFGTTWG